VRSPEYLSHDAKELLLEEGVERDRELRPTARMCAYAFSDRRTGLQTWPNRHGGVASRLRWHRSLDRLWGSSIERNGLQHDDGLIVQRFNTSAKAAQRRCELRSEFVGRSAVKLERDVHQPLTTELLASRIDGFRDAVAVQHHQVPDLRLYHRPLVVDILEKPERGADRPSSLARPLCFEPAPVATRGSTPKRWRVTRIRHDKQALWAVPSYRHHRGVVHPIELLANRVVEVPHESDLFQGSKVSLHQLLKLLAERLHRESMPADIGKRDARDDATRAERDVMDVAASVTGSGRYGVHPDNQTGQSDQARGSVVTGPCFRALKAFWHRRCVRDCSLCAFLSNFAPALFGPCASRRSLKSLSAFCFRARAAYAHERLPPCDVTRAGVFDDMWILRRCKRSHSRQNFWNGVERLALLLAIAWGGSVVSTSGQPSAEPATPFRSEWAMIGGSGSSVGSRQRADREQAFYAMEWGRVVSGEHGPGFLRGRLEMLIEITPMFLAFQSDRAEGAGFSPLMFRWNLREHEPIHPFLEVASGLVATNRDVPEETSRLNFASHASAGARVRLAERWGVVAGYRFQHLSNASIAPRNPGINSNIGYLGLAYRR
jgi:lipid A 3-O-deacylase PagL